MHLPRPRFTVRRLMTAVAVAGIMLAALSGLERRRAEYDRTFRYHYNRINSHLYIESYFLGIADDPREEESRDAKSAYHQMMARKYRTATARPWLPVPPDPPEPR